MIKRILTRIPVFIAVMVMFLAGACLVSPESMSIEICLTEFPETWSGADCWELCWETEDGSTGRVFASPGSKVSLDLPMAGSALIFTRALFGDNRTMPFGVIWPDGLEADGSLVPSAEGGWCASLALPLQRAGWDLRKFNWMKLRTALSARLSDAWVIDPETLCAALAEGKFRIDYLKEPQTRIETRVSGIGEILFPASPWGKILVPDADGAVQCGIPPGASVWIGSGTCLRLSASAAGEVIHTLSVMP